MSQSADRDTIAYRPALDGVRALAVCAVLMFHGGVSWLPGGFLGVDAFFVLSGFLITTLLLRERDRHGRIHLGAFWLRRARRLLPALVLVLLVVAIAYRGVLAPAELALLRGDALATLGYVANWRMIYRGDDYFTQTAAPSPLQHTWSLGIEEQFYLVWPLLVAVVLAFVLATPRKVLLATCLVGASASAVAAAVLFDPLDASRAYFGTDTRAQSLLIGAAVAVVLAPGAGRDRIAPVAGRDRIAPVAGRDRIAPVAGRDHIPPARPAWLRPAMSAAAAAGIAVTALLWARADGAQGWLYRGGLTAGALAVAAVLAHVTISPDAIVSRALGWTPLRLLGRISYGVYLWHWPLFGWLSSERTTLAGAPLLLLRVSVTVLLATVSFVLIEQPIRTRRWLAPHPARVAAVAMTAIIATGALVVVAAMPPRQATLASVSTLPVGADPGSGHGAAPILRPGRKPGSLPRIAFFGDSVSWTLGTYLPVYSSLAVTVRSVQGCGIARLPQIIQHGDGFTNYPGCTTWDARWRRGVNADDPDVAVILLDRWELMDRQLNGVYQHVGEPDYDAYLTMELELAVTVTGARGARVVLLTAPYTRRTERRDGGLFGEDEPERVDAWNRLIREVAARHPDQVSVIDLNRRVCPDGRFTWSVGNLRIRSDGLHFTPEGVRRWIAPWLMPQLATMAVTANGALTRGE